MVSPASRGRPRVAVSVVLVAAFVLAGCGRGESAGDAALDCDALEKELVASVKHPAVESYSAKSGAARGTVAALRILADYVLGRWMR